MILSHKSKSSLKQHSSNIVIKCGWFGFSFVRIVSAHVLLLDKPLNSGRKRRHFKRESNQSYNFLHQICMSEWLLCLKSLDNSSVDEEFTVSKNALMHTFTILFALFLLNWVDLDSFHLGSELVINSEGVLLSYGLFDWCLGFGHLTLFLLTHLPKVSIFLSCRWSFLSLGCSICVVGRGFCRWCFFSFSRRSGRDCQKKFLVKTS